MVVTFLGFQCGSVLAKTCTESTIRNAISKNKKFNFDKEGCNDSVIYVSKGIKLSGGVVIDGSGKMELSWKGEGSQCDEFPRNSSFSTFYTAGSNNVIKNLTILKSPEGIHLATGKNNIVDNVTFERICEDAITNGNKRTNSATGSIIRNSVFKNGPDKAIQCNGGSMTVQGSVFRDIPRSIGACTFKADPGFHAASECPQPCEIKAYDNDVYGCGGYAFRGAGYLQKKKVGTLTAIGNRFHDCKEPLLASQYGYVYAENNQAFGRCNEMLKTEEHSSGEMCGNDTSNCFRPSKGNVQEKCKAVGQPPSNPTKPTPPVSPPGNGGGENVVVYFGEGTGGTKLNLSREQQEQLACSRAEKRALDTTKNKCDSSKARIVKQSTECKECSSSGRGLDCVAEAKISCDYGANTPPKNGNTPVDPSEPPVLNPEPPVVNPEPPVVKPEPPVVVPEPPVTTPPPNEDGVSTITGYGLGKSNFANEGTACRRAQNTASKDALNKCNGSVISRELSACKFSTGSGRAIQATTTVEVKCRLN